MAQIRRRSLGRTGLLVGEVGLGAMDTPTAADGVETLTTALDLGIDFVDTAREYAGSEFLIGQVVRARGGADFHIATKTSATASITASATSTARSRSSAFRA